MRRFILIAQSLGLSQRQMQAMNLLAMTATELDAFLEETALENPVIEVVRPDVEVGVAIGDLSVEKAGFEWREAEAIDDGTPALEEYLLSQVNMARLIPKELNALRYLIGMIDENGYLTQSVEQAALCLDIDPPSVARMMGVLHTLEPHGIGARSVQESLLLQLDALSVDALLAIAIVRDHVSLLAKNRIAELERVYPGVGRDDVLEAVCLIRSLDPRPGARFARGRVQFVLADIVVETTDEDFSVRLGPAGGHDVRFDGSYRSKVRDSGDPEAQAWTQTRYREAYWLRSCLKQRRELMLSIAEQLVRRQKAFFAFGPRRLGEATMSRVAEDLSLSVSTVRAVKWTYVQCCWGVFPMKSLFSHPTIDRPAASDDPRVLLRDIVAAECPEKPLSDQKIVAEFARQGIELSRRTVARYRQELGIPSATERRYR